jgi:hypothetical protein
MLNEKLFRAIYDEYLLSGLTIRDFCSNQQIRETKFFYWKNKLKDQLPPKRGFVPLVIGPGQPDSQMPASQPGRMDRFPYQGNDTRQIFCEVSFPNGASIKVNGSLDAEMLRSLLVLTRQ